MDYESQHPTAEIRQLNYREKIQYTLLMYYF